MTISWISDFIVSFANRDQIVSPCYAGQPSERKVMAYIAYWISSSLSSNLISSNPRVNIKSMTSRVVFGLVGAAAYGLLFLVASRIYSFVPSFLSKRDELWKTVVLGVSSALAKSILYQTFNTCFFNNEDYQKTQKWFDFLYKHMRLLLSNDVDNNGDMLKGLIYDVFIKTLRLNTLFEMGGLKASFLPEEVVELNKTINQMRFDLLMHFDGVDEISSLIELAMEERRKEKNELSIKLAQTVLKSLKLMVEKLDSGEGTRREAAFEQIDFLEEYIKNVEKVSKLIADNTNTFSDLKTLATSLFSSEATNAIIYTGPSFLISQVEARILNSGHNITLLPIHMMMLLSPLACLVNTILTRNFGFAANFLKEPLPSLEEVEKKVDDLVVALEDLDNVRKKHQASSV